MLVLKKSRQREVGVELKMRNTQGQVLWIITTVNSFRWLQITEQWCSIWQTMLLGTRQYVVNQHALLQILQRNAKYVSNLKCNK